jgi:hypothetical protein
MDKVQLELRVLRDLKEKVVLKVFKVFKDL